MIKKIIAGVCLIFSAAGFAQENNASPYSYYGIGDVKFKGTTENRSMGGLGILPDSIHINLQNPATYSSLKFTTYTIGASDKVRTLKTNDGKENASRVTLDYLAVALPFNKVGFAFGLMPYTSVGYKIQDNKIVDDVEYVRRFNGSGGINRAFFGGSYRITPKLSVGADFQYNFGDIETKSIVTLPGTLLQYPTREINESFYNGVSFNLGATYQTKLKDLNWTSSVTYSPKSTLKSTTDRDLATITLTALDAEIVQDQLATVQVKDEVDMPSVFSVGTGFGRTNKWFAGVEYTSQSSNSLGARFDNVTNVSFKSLSRIAFGGYYIPKYNSFNSYLSRVTYRAGLRFENTGLVINNEDINDTAFTFGMGLPLGTGFSNLNVGFEIGKKGTTKANLVQENYVNIMLSLSINDRWFAKRRYD
ncbi:MAG: hypothetical protein DI539_24960 [Flavobacterium psychrophilum]|nr:MAG: hypothetical protein DI539_24960 [Flavobacterium psychrophilum]